MKTFYWIFDPVEDEFPVFEKGGQKNADGTVSDIQLFSCVSAQDAGIASYMLNRLKQKERKNNEQLPTH